MAIETPRRPEEEIHGEPESKPRFGPGSDEAIPSGNPTDPRGNDTPSAKGGTDPRGDKVADRDSLKAAEEKGGSPAEKSVHHEKLGAGYRHGDKGTGTIRDIVGNKLSGFGLLIKRNKKKTAGGVLAGLVVSGGIFGMSIVQGPLQLIHLSQVLQSNFLPGEDDADLRLRKLWRYYRTGDPGSTRVGTLGQKVFNNVSTQFEEKGYKFNRTKTVGNPMSLEIDTSKENAFKGLSKEEVRTKLSQQTGIPESKLKVGQISNLNGSPKIAVVMTELDGSELRKVTNMATTDVSKGRTMTAINNRIVRKFFAITMHPLNKVKRDQANNYEEYTREKERERQKKVRSESTSRLSEAREKIKSTVGESRAAKVTGGVMAGTGAVCMVKDLSGIVPEFNSALRTDSIVAAYDLISVGAQIQAGHDFDIGQLGGIVQNFEDEDGKSIWEGKALQASTDDTPKGEDVDKGVKQAYTGEGSWQDIHNFIGSVPGVNFVCSTGGQIISGVIGLALLATGPGGWAIKAGQTFAGAATTYAVLNLVSGLIEPDASLIPETIAGPKGGNYIAYGAREAANVGARANGGVELSSEETAQIDRDLLENSRSEFANKSFFAKTFDIYDYRSVASGILRKVSFNLKAPIDFSSISSFPGTLLNSLFGKTAHAEDTYDWGFNRYGIRQSVLDDDKYADGVANAEKAIASIEDDSDLADRVKSCFGVTYNSGTGGFEKEESVDQFNEAYQSSDCDDDSETWNRISLAVFDDSLVVATGCYQGDSESCEELGISEDTGSESGGTGGEGSVDPSIKFNVGDIFKSSANISCANGTKDLGVQDGYHDGQKVDIRVCAVESVPETGDLSTVKGADGKLVVNSLVSAAVVKMFQDAKKDGVSPVDASEGFRTMERQKYLFTCGCTGGNPVATPGTSNHQMGIALDLNGPMQSWAIDNGQKYGFKWYGSDDPPHFSPDGH